WRCLDCVGWGTFCAKCCRANHIYQPLHRVEHWTGTHYTPASLCSVHISISLGHCGRACP
ncbi:hypothetical protein LXA43DRAFT_874969, partial [Ganoderma leucocontextum]